MTTLNKMLLWERKNLPLQQLPNRCERATTSKAPHANKQLQSWRRNPAYFNSGISLTRGIVDIASCWFQVGRSVSDMQNLFHELLNAFNQGRTSKPEVSRALKTPNSHVMEWLMGNQRFLFIITSVLAVVHRQQYEAGFAMLARIRAHPELLREPEEVWKVLSTWCCPFTGVSVISNRQTPSHRDAQTNPYWYDILSTMGTYTNLRFHLKSLGLSFSYRPGTVVALCGKILSHEADAIEYGDRACFAWFMREDVRNYLGVSTGQPSTLTAFLHPVTEMTCTL